MEMDGDRETYGETLRRCRRRGEIGGSRQLPDDGDRSRTRVCFGVAIRLLAIRSDVIMRPAAHVGLWALDQVVTAPFVCSKKKKNSPIRIPAVF